MPGGKRDKAMPTSLQLAGDLRVRALLVRSMIERRDLAAARSSLAALREDADHLARLLERAAKEPHP